MTGLEAFGTGESPVPTWSDGKGTNRTTMEDLVQAHCETGRRHSLRVIGEQARGNVFFDQGRIVHAEFGEDTGLRALVQMMRAGAVQTQACTRRWPSHPSLNLEPQTVLAQKGAGLNAAGIVNKTAVVKRSRISEASAGAVNDSIQDSASFIEPPPLPECFSDTSEPTRPEPTEPPHPPSKSPVLEETTVKSSASVELASFVSSPVSVSLAETAALSAPVSQPAAPVVTAEKEAVAKPAGDVLEVSPEPVEPATRQDVEAVCLPLSSELRPSEPVSSFPLPSPVLRFTIRRPSVSPAALRRQREQKNRTKSHRPASSAADSATTMVRLSSKGRLLAARGELSEELADAAAYIHDMVKLIASDLNRRGHASVHLRGQGRSLIVARSEIKDVAAALGPTAKLSSLLTKSGMR